MPTSRSCCRPSARRRLEQVVPQAVDLGRGADRHAAADQGHGGARRSCRCSCARAGSSRRSTAASMAELMYDAVTSMGAPQQSARIAAAVRPYARSVRDADRLSRLSAARADPRSAADPRARASPRAAVHAIGGGPTARSRAISISTMRRRWPSRRARPRRFRAPFRRRGSWRWTSWSRGGGRHWPRRDEFIAEQFRQSSAGRSRSRPRRLSSTARCSTTGRSSEAISAIQGRPAYRQVDRRLVYIEPHPAPPVSAVSATTCRDFSPRCAARCRTSRAPSRSPTS